MIFGIVVLYFSRRGGGEERERVIGSKGMRGVERDLKDLSSFCYRGFVFKLFLEVKIRKL